MWSLNTGYIITSHITFYDGHHTCSFWPLSCSVSMASHGLHSPERTDLQKISAHLRFRPPKQVVTRSATPHDSRNVSPG